MKKVLCVLLVMLLLVSLCSCVGTPSGTYDGYYGGTKLGMPITFKGKEATKADDGSILKGKVTINGDNIHIDWEDGLTDDFTYDKSSDTLDFYGIVTYKK